MTPRAYPPHIELGVRGEETACEILIRKGYKLLDRNWRFGHLELDLVCERAGEIVFVEVKTRTSTICGGPLAGLTPKKIKNLALAAQAWINANEAWNLPCRMDVITLTRSGPDYIMEHFINAIELSHTLDSSHSAGEYW